MAEPTEHHDKISSMLGSEPGGSTDDSSGAADAGVHSNSASVGENSANGDKATKSQAAQGPAKQRKPRTLRTFPASSFTEALPLAEAIQRFAAGKRIRRLTLFENLGRSPDSGHSRQLITNSGQYGLTTGSYNAEYLELTDAGMMASGDPSLGRARLAAQLDLAIARVVPFNAIYDQYKGNRLPTLAVLRDFTIEQGTAPDNADECVQTFLVNARDLGLARNYAGAERLLTFEMLLDDMRNDEGELTEQAAHGDEPAVISAMPSIRAVVPAASPSRILAEVSDLSNVCFLISPIGQEGSEQRQHADLVLGSLIEPALDGLGLRLVRADKISRPGLITAQVIDHIVRSPLVIADLSFNNPNVFYELALRHSCRKPAVQLIRSSDSLPFDVGQFRTVVLDMTDIYSLVPQIESYRAEIARQCRTALDDEGPADSPLSLFYPEFWKQFGLP